MLRVLSIALYASCCWAVNCTFSYRNGTVFNADGWGNCKDAHHVTTVTGVEVQVDDWFDDDLKQDAQCYWPAQHVFESQLALETWPAGTDSVLIDCGSSGGGEGGGRSLRLLRVVLPLFGVIAAIAAVCACKSRKMFCFKPSREVGLGIEMGKGVS